MRLSPFAHEYYLALHQSYNIKSSPDKTDTENAGGGDNKYIGAGLNTLTRMTPGKKILLVTIQMGF